MPPIEGSGVIGINTSVKATRAIALGVDGDTHVHVDTGWVKVFGDLEVTEGISDSTGDLSPELSERLDNLTT